MRDIERILVLFVAAVVLAAAARRAGAPYPVFLAIGGALLAFVPGVPSLSLPPDLVLALFVAPILVDAGYDASLRDLRDHWGATSPRRAMPSATVPTTPTPSLGVAMRPEFSSLPPFSAGTRAQVTCA